MFGHLTDPHPPTPGPRERTAVAARARHLLRRRRLFVALASAAPVIASGLVLASLGVDGGDQQVEVGAPGEETTTTLATIVPTLPSTTTTARVVLPTSTTTTTAPRIESACNQPVERTAPPPEVEVWVTLDKSVYARGERVVATVHVRNRTDAPFDYSDTHGGPNDNVHILTGDGMVLWRGVSSPTAITTRHTLQPGEERTAVRTWEQNYCTRTTANGYSSPGSVPPGRYTAHGMWRHGWWAPPVDFEIR